MMRTLGNFKWESGSINDNIRKLLSARGMAYQNTFNGDIIVNVGRWEKVQYTLTNPANETYVVYLD